MGRPVNAHIDPLTPDMRLAIEIIDIAKQDPYPETLLDKADGPLNFSFRLWRAGFANLWSDPD